MRDLKRARKIAQSDPEGALALLEKHLLPTPGIGLDDKLELSKMRVDLYTRLDRPEAAAKEEADAARFLEDQLEITRRLLPEDKDPKWNLAGVASLLERLGRDEEATPYWLLCADYWLANTGDPGAIADLRAAAARPQETEEVPIRLGKMFGDAIGGGRAFSAGFKRAVDNSDRTQAWHYRDIQVDAGRAVAYARCKICDGVVGADYKTNCCVSGHKVSRVRVAAAKHAKPNWYHDPWKRYALRWFDGEAWTAHVTRGTTAEVDPLGSADIHRSDAGPAGPLSDQSP